ncbi:MAG: baseplate J/gp47 family protein [Planctomycetes bacterium]|nr:baseplate J/gp47 family protein [Planctomycetota bacterium]
MTERDFAAVATAQADVERASVFAQSSLWRFAVPGTVQILLVPHLPEAKNGQAAVTHETLAAHQTQDGLAKVNAALERRRPVGTSCVVAWADYKTVSISAKIVVGAEEDGRAIHARILNRIHGLLSPLSGWAFGRSLREAEVYDVVLREPAVRTAEEIRFRVRHAPAMDVNVVADDPFHPKMWYAGAGCEIYRSHDDGEGWQRIGCFPDESIQVIEANPTEPGLLAVVSKTVDDTRASSKIRISRDCGSSWGKKAELDSTVHDVAWTRRSRRPLLIAAAGNGLYEVTDDMGFIPKIVDRADQKLGFYSVAVSHEVGGATTIALAAKSGGGVYFCENEQLSGFEKGGLDGADIRVLRFQQLGSRSFLWAGTWVRGHDNPGEGCHRQEMTSGRQKNRKWKHLGTGWDGGHCIAIDFDGAIAYAASYRSGVLKFDTRPSKNPAWVPSEGGCGLPYREGRDGFAQVESIATARIRPIGGEAAEEARSPMVVATKEGVLRSTDGGVTFQKCSDHVFTERVSLGPTQLFCSGEHDIKIVAQDEQS